jgi:hypothetical protein
MLIAGGAVGVVGAGVGLFVLRDRRQDAATERYIGTDVPVDEFVQRTMDAFDEGTWGDPRRAHGDDYDAREKSDGRISLGIEDTIGDDEGYFRELVEVPQDSYYAALSGREFLRRADSDADGHVTRDELTAAVRPHAGDDGKLDLAERKRVLLDEGLAKVVNTEQLEPIAGWSGSEAVVTAWEAAQEAMYQLRDQGAEMGEQGDEPVLLLGKGRPIIPWNYGKLTTGDITSTESVLVEIDQASNKDGKLTQAEIADWIAVKLEDPKLLRGHVRITSEPEGDYDEREDLLRDVLKGVRIARVDASTLDGHIYWDTSIPKADVDSLYGGDIRTYLDAVKGFRAARGGAEWEPDPLSGKPSPKPKDGEGG